MNSLLNRSNPFMIGATVLMLAIPAVVLIGCLSQPQLDGPVVVRLESLPDRLSDALTSLRAAKLEGWVIVTMALTLLIVPQARKLLGMVALVMPAIYCTQVSGLFPVDWPFWGSYTVTGAYAALAAGMSLWYTPALVERAAVVLVIALGGGRVVLVSIFGVGEQAVSSLLAITLILSPTAAWTLLAAAWLSRGLELDRPCMAWMVVLCAGILTHFRTKGDWLEADLQSAVAAAIGKMTSLMGRLWARRQKNPDIFNSSKAE